MRWIPLSEWTEGGTSGLGGSLQWNAVLKTQDNRAGVLNCASQRRGQRKLQISFLESKILSPSRGRTTPCKIIGSHSSTDRDCNLQGHGDEAGDSAGEKRGKKLMTYLHCHAATVCNISVNWFRLHDHWIKSGIDEYWLVNPEMILDHLVKPKNLCEYLELGSKSKTCWKMLIKLTNRWGWLQELWNRSIRIQIFHRNPIIYLKHCMNQENNCRFRFSVGTVLISYWQNKTGSPTVPTCHLMGTTWWVPRALSWEIKQLERETNYSLSSSPDFKKMWSFPLFSLRSLMSLR